MNEEKARKALGDIIKSDNDLYGRGVDWVADEHVVVLQGEFNAETLQALVWWMENKS